MIIEGLVVFAVGSVILGAVAAHASWRNGVRDGFYNANLPHVAKVIKEDVHYNNDLRESDLGGTQTPLDRDRNARLQLFLFDQQIAHQKGLAHARQG